MPRADFFEKLGLFAVEGFLDASACRELRAGIQSAQRNPATVASHGDYVVDRARRSANWIAIGHQTVSAVRARLLEVLPDVAAHYGIALTDCQKPQFLAYGPGDHYKAHRDSGGSEVSKERKVS